MSSFDVFAAPHRSSGTLDAMSESLTHYRTICREAFAFLTSDYAFREIENSADSFNPYIVAFGNGEIVLRVIGEGYGTVARAEYIAPDGRTVPSAILESDWDANPRRKKRHRITQSQDDQIRGAAERVRERDQDVINAPLKSPSLYCCTPLSNSESS